MTFNGIMKRIDDAENAIVFEQWVALLSKHRKKYTLNQLYFAVEFISDKRLIHN